MVLTDESTRFQMPWDALDAVIEGRSPVDLASLPVKNRDEATDLVSSYGYDLSLSEDRQEIEALMKEAVHFINHRLLDSSVPWEDLKEPPSPADHIPRNLIESNNIVDLILTASGKAGAERQWACALLKVMHTLAYIQNGLTYKYFEEASSSILDKFNSVLIPQADDTFLLKGAEGDYLKVVAFETKYQKARESILIKLLCKKENVAEAVWDLVGIRLVTEHPAEVIQVINLLREKQVIVISNVIPNRTRNTLIDYESLKSDFEMALLAYQNGQAEEKDIKNFFQTWSHPYPEGKDFSENPSSSQDYRSIHITCRHLLLLDSLDGKHKHRFAFPYELQLMDKANYEQSQSGKSAHVIYKKKQLAAARRRVLGKLLKRKGTKS